jgi:DGQHR domain-containing protein
METQEKLESGLVEIRTYPTYEQAATAAYSESMNTGGWTFPVVAFRQGKRLILAGAFPIGFVESRLYSRSAVRGEGASSALASMNRPLEPKHKQHITKYLVENVTSNYIMPPLTLNVQEKVSLFTVASGHSFRSAYLAIPGGVNLSITDGQHRVQAIKEALAQLSGIDGEVASRLRADSISVMITCENDLKQIHQDFADCSKTKALPGSLLSLYDTRNPANRLVSDLEQNCVLFRGRIDPTSKTLSKKSTFLFLANQLRQLVKHLITRTNPADDEFEKRVTNTLSDKERYRSYSELYVDYVNCITEAIPVFKHISNLSTQSPERGQIEKSREAGWVCLSGTGLNVLGCLGYDLFTYGVGNWKHYVSELINIDWSRSASLWQGNIIQNGKMMTQMPSMRAAAEQLEREIGLYEVIKAKKEEFGRKS